VSDKLAEHVRRKREKDNQRRDDDLPEQERRVRQKIIDEAKENGATLDRPDAKGGLPPSLVLGAFRKSRWRCSRCGGRDKLGPHPIRGIVAAPRLSRLGHRNKISNLTALCRHCHDALHEEARAEGVDSSQITPRGDEGTDRDIPGKPVDDSG